MNVRDKYDFWTDRKTGGFVYRFSTHAVKRHLIGGPEHWEVFQEFDDPRQTARAWQTICDSAGQEAKAHA
jgi:hypothetical protein